MSFIKSILLKLQNKRTDKRNDFVRGKSILKNIYNVISVISTLTIFSAFMLFLVGKLGLESSSDDDLIMRDIKKQIPKGLTITEIITEDIHGFGNNSIIVLADGYNSDSSLISANQLLIFDKVENDVLNRIYHLFGFGSGYKLSYLFSLESPEYYFSEGYYLNLLDTVELTGDSSKELVVMFMSIPSGTSGNYEIGIFSYSFEKHSYYLLGTYPPVIGYELDQMRIFSSPAPTIFHSEQADQYNFYDRDSVFKLESGHGDDNDLFIESNLGRLLVRTKMIWGDESHFEPHRHTISVFIPTYNSEKDELEWDVIFSTETEEYVQYCTQDFIENYLKRTPVASIID